LPIYYQIFVELVDSPTLALIADNAILILAPSVLLREVRGNDHKYENH